MVCTGTQTLDPVVFSLSTFQRRPRRWLSPNRLFYSIRSPLKLDAFPSVSFSPKHIIDGFD